MNINTVSNIPLTSVIYNFSQEGAHFSPPIEVDTIQRLKEFHEVYFSVVTD